MEKSGLKTPGHRAIFLVPEVKRSKYYKNWINETVFNYILGFTFYAAPWARTDWHKKYMI